MTDSQPPLFLTLELPLHWPSLEQEPSRMDTLLALSLHHDALWVDAQLEAIVESWPSGVDQATFNQMWDKVESSGVQVRIMCTMLHDPARLLASFSAWQRTEHIDELYRWQRGIDVYTKASRSTMELFNAVVGKDLLSKQDVEALREGLPAHVFGAEVFAKARAERLEEDLPASQPAHKPRM